MEVPEPGVDGSGLGVERVDLEVEERSGVDGAGLGVKVGVKRVDVEVDGPVPGLEGPGFGVERVELEVEGFDPELDGPDPGADEELGPGFEGTDLEVDELDRVEGFEPGVEGPEPEVEGPEPELGAVLDDDVFDVEPGGAVERGVEEAPPEPGAAVPG